MKNLFKKQSAKFVQNPSTFTKGMAKHILVCFFMPHSVVSSVIVICSSSCDVCETGVTQEQIDETRLMMDDTMLSDMQNILNGGGNLEFHGQSGETPVMQELHTCSTDILFQEDGEILLIMFVVEIHFFF